MKLKTWVTAALILLTTFDILLLLTTDNIIANVITLAATLLNVVLLTKYSGICD